MSIIGLNSKSNERFVGFLAFVMYGYATERNNWYWLGVYLFARFQFDNETFPDFKIRAMNMLFTLLDCQEMSLTCLVLSLKETPLYL